MACADAVALVNYGAGNYSSVANALARLEIPFFSASSEQDLRRARRIILPGVGSFQAAMSRLAALGLDAALVEHCSGQGKPLLGICVGMQILADLGHEHGQCRGLGLIPGEVDLLTPDQPGALLPHIGWSEVLPARQADGQAQCVELLAHCQQPATFYFVHSYAFTPADPAHAVAFTDYGGSFASMVNKGNLWGVQFHPEKSQQDGMQLLRNFAATDCRHG